MVNLTFIVLSDIRQLNTPRSKHRKVYPHSTLQVYVFIKQIVQGFLSSHYFRNKIGRKIYEHGNTKEKKRKGRDMIINREWRHENTAGDGDWGTTTLKLLGHMKNWKPNGRVENKNKSFKDVVEGLCVVWGYYRAQESGLMATKEAWNRISVWCIILVMAGMLLIRLSLSS